MGKVTLEQLQKDGWITLGDYCGRILLIQREGEVKGYIPALEIIVELKSHYCAKP